MQKKCVSGIKLFNWVQPICLPCRGTTNKKMQSIGIATVGFHDGDTGTSIFLLLVTFTQRSLSSNLLA